MSLWQRWYRWAHRENELDEEIQTHLRMAERDRTERGETAEDARAHVRREFGNVLLTKEVTREQWGSAWLDQFILDLRFAVRQFLKSGAFAATAIIVLALALFLNNSLARTTALHRSEIPVPATHAPRSGLRVPGEMAGLR